MKGGMIFATNILSADVYGRKDFFMSEVLDRCEGEMNETEIQSFIRMVAEAGAHQRLFANHVEIQKDGMNDYE